MGDIWSLSDYGSGDSDPRTFIQCVDDKDPMAHKLWSHGLDEISLNVHPI